MNKNRIPLKFYAPKFWGAWIGIFFLRIIAFIPSSWMKKISTFLGRLFFKTAKTRRRIIETNINLCFPDKSDEERKEHLFENEENDYSTLLLQLESFKESEGLTIRTDKTKTLKDDFIVRRDNSAGETAV